MTETLLTRLERYGDDLDRAATDDTPRILDAPLPERRRGRRPVLAFAAACLALAAVASALVVVSRDGDDTPVADESAPTTESTSPDATTPIEQLTPVFAQGFPTEEFSEEITLDNGFVVEVSFVEPSFSVGSRDYGDPNAAGGGSSIIDRDVFEDGTFTSPVITMSSYGGDFAGHRPLMTFVGAVGDNVARVEMTDGSGQVHGVDTVAIEGFPGIRVWGLNVPEGQRVVRHVYLSDRGEVLRDETSCRETDLWILENGEASSDSGGVDTVPNPEEKAAWEECRNLAADG
jgi:hypothetical protein